MGSILVVDDEKSIRVTVKAFLEADGHLVETAEEAETAMMILRSKLMDVVLTDIILPRVSGIELLRGIKDVSPNIQVIMMTGEPTLETASEALRLGAVDYLQKPAGKDEILKVVRNALQVKCLHDEKRRLEEENRTYLNRLELLVEKRTRDLAASEAALRHRAEELATLNRLSRKVSESVTVAEAIQCGLREIVNSIAPDLAVFFLRTGEELILKGQHPELLEGGWQSWDTHRVGECLCGLAVTEGKMISSTDIRTDVRCTLMECIDAGFKSFAALPLRSGIDIIGVLGIACYLERDFSEKASFLEAIANDLAIGLKKSLLYEEVQQHLLDLKISLSLIEEAENEHRRLEQHLQQSQKMEAIGTLSSGIAHDFNNILGGIIGYTELVLMDTPPDSHSRKNLQMVLTAAGRAKALIRQILAFSRQSKEEKKTIKLAHTVKEVLSFMRASLPATIEIQSYIDVKMEPIFADPVQIHQVFMNLCTNAHHAMKEKGGVLEVRVAQVVLGDSCGIIHPDLKPGTYAKATVRDTGHGMDPTTLSKIFDPYFTTKEKGVGTGLGLAVVQGIVQKHGGAITVESELGKGTVFELYFQSVANEAVTEPLVSSEIPHGNERILLVDDEKFLVDIGRQMLERLGYQVQTRTSSMEALSLFSSQPFDYDLIVTDLTMPQMTGDRLAEEMIRIRPDIPVVLCTGYSERILEDRVKEIGIKALVMKPILMMKLGNAVRQALDGLATETQAGRFGVTHRDRDA